MARTGRPRTGENRVCPICSKAFYVTRSLIERGRKAHCSAACRAAGLRDRQEKRCIRCNQVLPSAEFYFRAISGYFSSECKHCRQSRDRARYASEPAWRTKLNARAAQWRDANRARHRADAVRYYWAHRDRYREQGRQRWAKHETWETPEKRARRLATANAYMRELRKRFPDMAAEQRREYTAKYPERSRQWAQTHPERVAEATSRHRARMRSAPVVEDIDRMAIIERDSGRCYLCGVYPAGRQLSLDHVVPLSRGGHHTMANLRVACGRCNSRKGGRLLSELRWYTNPLGISLDSA